MGHRGGGGGGDAAQEARRAERLRPAGCTSQPRRSGLVGSAPDQGSGGSPRRPARNAGRAHVVSTPELKLGFKASAEQFDPRELVEIAVLAEAHGMDSVTG